MGMSVCWMSSAAVLGHGYWGPWGSGSLTKSRGHQLAHTDWPTSHRDLPVSGSPVLELQIKAANSTLHKGSENPSSETHAYMASLLAKGSAPLSHPRSKKPRFKVCSRQATFSGLQPFYSFHSRIRLSLLRHESREHTNQSSNSS